MISFMTEVPIIYPYRFGLQINDWSLSDGDLCHERIKYYIFVLWFYNYYVWDEGSCNFITKTNKWWLFVWHIECGKEKRRPIINKVLAKCQLDKHKVNRNWWKVELQRNKIFSSVNLAAMVFKVLKVLLSICLINRRVKT